MNKKVVMIDVNADSRSIRELLGMYKHNVFPLVDSLESRILIGSITRSELSKSLEMSLDRPLECASVNPAPAMVSDRLSLHRLHTMFSLLSLKRAYVVSAGRLVGVVSVPELTKEIIGAASDFNAQRSESMSSLIPLYDANENSDEDEVIFQDESFSRITPSYSRMRTGL